MSVAEVLASVTLPEIIDANGIPHRAARLATFGEGCKFITDLDARRRPASHSPECRASHGPCRPECIPAENWVDVITRQVCATRAFLLGLGFEESLIDSLPEDKPVEYAMSFFMAPYQKNGDGT
jgi:hypothetical protein